MKLRLLLGNLFHHFSSLLPSKQSDHSDGDNRINDIDDSDNNKNIVPFEKKFYHVFQEDYRSTNNTNHRSISRFTSKQTDRDVGQEDAILLPH